MPLRDYEHMDLPDGVTPEEARWYSAQRQADIDQAVERSSTHLMRRALTGFLILFVGLLIAIKVGSDYNADRVREASLNRGAIVASGRLVSIEGCNRDFRTISGVRAILLRAQASIKIQHEQGIYDDKQYKLAQDYYDKALRDVKLPDCRRALTLITDDPTQAQKPPPPYALYPGAPQDPERKATDPKPNG